MQWGCSGVGVGLGRVTLEWGSCGVGMGCGWGWVGLRWGWGGVAMGIGWGWAFRRGLDGLWGWGWGRDGG